MSLFTDLFAYFAPKQPILGANIDTRSPEQKKGDYHISEIVASASPVVWAELAPSEVRSFPVQNQSQKSDCVAETRRKLKRITMKVNKGLDLDFSSVALYRERINYPDAGMGAIDAISIDANIGMTLDALVPSDVIKNEVDVNKLTVDAYNVDVAKVFRTANTDITFTNGDLETLAVTIQKTRKGAMVWFYFTAEEWAREVPIIINGNLSLYDAASLRHSVTAVEPAMYNGKKGVWIEDSAHFGGLNRRFITEAFYKVRNFWASYPTNLKFEAGGNIKPRYDGSIISLQDCLRFEGYFPVDRDSTGIFGPITTKAVKDFQKANGLEQVGTVGPKTKELLEQKYP
jgi:hypothetical protein